MLNYAIDESELLALVPVGTELDRWDGNCFISIVAFRFLNTRIRGVPIPFHRDFDEINLRFYVKRAAADGSRRGVVFVKEVVPRRAIAWVARRLYNENYVACPTRSSVLMPDGGTAGTVEYAWTHAGDELSVRATVSSRPEIPDDDSVDAFITEHYWGYVRQRDGSTVEYRVEHPQWRVWQADTADFTGDRAGFYGTRFATALSAEPHSAFVADGSPVEVMRGVLLARPHE